MLKRDGLRTMPQSGSPVAVTLNIVECTSPEVIMSYVSEPGGTGWFSWLIRGTTPRPSLSKRS